MIGEIYKITKPPVRDGAIYQLKLGYTHLREGTLVLIIDDLGGGLFYVLSPSGKVPISEDYLVSCLSSSRLVN